MPVRLLRVLQDAARGSEELPTSPTGACAALVAPDRGGWATAGLPAIVPIRRACCRTRVGSISVNHRARDSQARVARLTGCLCAPHSHRKQRTACQSVHRRTRLHQPAYARGSCGTEVQMHISSVDAGKFGGHRMSVHGGSWGLKFGM